MIKVNRFHLIFDFFSVSLLYPKKQHNKSQDLRMSGAPVRAVSSQNNVIRKAYTCVNSNCALLESTQT